MNAKRMIVVAVAAASTATLAVAAGEGGGKKDASRVARGKYLVTQVAMCIDCHSPRDERGQYIQARWLQGAPLDFKATVPIPGWAEVAPPLAGLPGWTEAQLVTLLTTGKDQKGGQAGPPMPQYRMSKEDASAVAAYLVSIGEVAKR
jgi:mono/diheme cytochrome c family protein